MDVSEAQKAYKAAAATAQQKYLKGVQGTKSDPIQKAIQAAPKWAAGVAKAAANDSFARGLGKKTKQQWIDSVQKKGAANYATGLQAGGDAYAAKMNAMKPDLDRIEAEIDAMPDATEADRDAKMAANVRLRRELKGRF